MKKVIQLCALAAATAALLTSCPPGPTAPTVTISAPSDTTYTNGSVTVQLTVTGDPTGVELLKDGAALATLTAPYSYTWNTASEPEKSYVLTAKATKASDVVTSAAKTVIVDRTAPTVSAFAPANNTKNVYLRDEISLTFSEAVQPSSVNSTSVILEQSPIPVQIVIPTALTLDAAGKKLTIKPTSRPDNLGGPITFKVEGVKDLAGNAMTLTSSSFTTPEWQAPGGVAPLDLNVALTADTAPQSLAVDASGNQVIAWSESDGTSTNIYVKRWNGSVWTQVGGLLDVNTNKDAFRTSLALDGSGNPVVAWSELRATSTQAASVYVKRWNGSVWAQLGSGALETGTDTQIGAGSPSLVLDGSGVPVMAFSEFNGTAYNGFVKRWNAGTSTWTAVGDQLNINTAQNLYGLSCHSHWTAAATRASLGTSTTARRSTSTSSASTAFPKHSAGSRGQTSPRATV